MFCIVKHGLLHSEKTVFYSLKGRLLQLKRKPAVLLTTCIMFPVSQA